MGKALKSIKEYGAIAFTLLGILFGMFLMVVLFGNLDGAVVYTQDAVTVVNETGGFANATGYTVDQVASSTGAANFVLTAVWNYTIPSSNVSVPLTNVSLGSSTGVLTNATVITYPNLSLSYTNTKNPEEEIVSDGILNDSLVSITTYTGQSSSQFRILAFAILFIILVGLFLLFWKIFVADKGKSGSASREVFS